MGFDDSDEMKNEDKIIGNLLYHKLWEIAEVRPDHPLIVPMIRKKQLKKEVIGIVILFFSCFGGYPFLLGLGISFAGWLANEFTKIDRKYPIPIISPKIPTHLFITIALNIILAITISW